MAGLLVLYIDDKIVGPHLELLRRVCEPRSSSRPHITVRYARRLGIPSSYFELEVAEVALTEPGSFGLERNDRDTRRTIYIGCKSDYLKHWEFKPDFKASEFHITVYNGKSRSFAAKLLKTLQKFQWNVRVPLPKDSQLQELPFEKTQRQKSQPKFSSAVKTLFNRITGTKLTIKRIEDLDDVARLNLVEKICQHFEATTAKFERHDVVSARDWAISAELDSPVSKSLPSIETGIHLTPPELALEIAKYTLSLRRPDEGKIKFGDPAVGTGIFYSALLKSASKGMIANAIGVDIDREQVLAAHRRWSNERLDVKHGDYLHMDDLPLRNLILANPPYLRHNQIPKSYRAQLYARASTLTGMKVHGSPGLYVYFLLLSHVWMEADALATWLIPATFLDTDYGEIVRYYLTNKVRLIRIHRYGSLDRKFENALVNTAVVVFRNLPPDSTGNVVLSQGGSLDNPSETRNACIRELVPSERWFLRPPTVSVAASDLRIGDLFDIKRGIATGANSFFILNEKRIQELGIPREFLQPVLPKIRALDSDIIEKHKNGDPKIAEKLFVINCPLGEDELRQSYPHFFRYLMSADESVRNAYLVRRRDPWYRQEYREPSLFLCTYMGRRKAESAPVRFLWNKSNAIATNTYLMLYPNPRLRRLLDNRPDRTSELFELLRRIPDETMSDSWRILAEGLHKIEPGELDSVKIPDVPEWLALAREEGIFDS